MQLTFINKTQKKVADKLIQQDLHRVVVELKKHLPQKKQKILDGHQELTIYWVGQKTIFNLNKNHRGLAKPTDVLSFEMPPPFLGELVFCVPVLSRQALLHQLSFRQEFIYLLIHGILHLLGYDHEFSKTNARALFAIQDKVFERFQKQKLVDY
jgi:probable rRNA maturation factor